MPGPEMSPNPFSSSPSPGGTPTRPLSPVGEEQRESSPNPQPLSAANLQSHGMDDSPSKSGYMSGASASAFKRPSAPSSMISAASGSPPPTHRASFPDPRKEPKRGASRLVGPSAKQGNCCERDKIIQDGGQVKIIDAFKTTEGGRASYITYVIQLGEYVTRRRYSSFLSLHQALLGLYPVLIIPPIPSKQSLADYAVKGQTKAKEDATVIARRKRLLEDFLRRLIKHPILGGEHVLHRFLEDGVSWSEVINSPPVSLLPKNPLHAPSHNPTFQAPQSPSSGASASSAGGPDSPTTPYIAHHLLPNPSANHPLHHPDQRFHDSEVFTEKFQTHFTGTMEKVNRRVVKRWGERAADMSELGAVWNGFSLVEHGKVGEAVERVGQAVDNEYLQTAALLQAWERSTTEPLHIYGQFATLIRSRLAFRHQKHVQYELVQEALETQRDKLELLESAEKEARRLEDALERGGRMGSEGGSESGNRGDGGEDYGAGRNSMIERETAARTVSRARGSGFGLISAVKHSLSGMMDHDPEATRRANIGKTRDNISQLEDSLQASEQDLKYASSTLQADLDRFQRQKVADLRQMTIELAKVHREWCRANLEYWQKASEAIREIPPHPNQPPESALPPLPSKLDDAAEMSRSSRAQQPPPETPPVTLVSGTYGGDFSASVHERLEQQREAEEQESVLKVGGIRAEIDRIEAANVPLPLPEQKPSGASTNDADPLGPL